MHIDTLYIEGSMEANSTLISALDSVLIISGVAYTIMAGRPFTCISLCPI